MKIFFSIFLCFPLFCNAQSLMEFISSNKSLNDNVEARILVKSQASLMAYAEAQSEGSDNAVKRSRYLLQNEGEKYGALSLKKVKLFCAGDDTALDLPPYDYPDKELCNFFMSLK
ncbi:hypothetical protein ACOGYG_001389 [Edwardsiella piscicida]|uniref:hypothetical protein n=2 Tax=Edwardsiella piscicida TaxID=1263550 RepID=UPI00034DF2D5|nr:hypothetical protein [Edwardsiella piscicida]EKS7782938.1 hypothetical protein [Edwardsiella piscicida]UCQ33875.1 hypothetical protein DCF34_12955 [Edwardsiella piscicida]